MSISVPALRSVLAMVIVSTVGAPSGVIAASLSSAARAIVVGTSKWQR